MNNTSSFDYAHSTALVTGASRGIGAAIARELARRGIRGLVLTARTEDDLAALAAELRGRYPTVRVEIIVSDLAHADAPEKLKAETDRLGLAVDLLVNNAGFGLYGLFDESDLAKNAAMVELNIAALVKLTHLYLTPMRQSGRGGILNVASTAGFQPVPYMAAYSATKAFVLSFSEALWAEAQEWGPEPDVRIVCLCPGGTETNFGDGMIRGRWEDRPQSTPEEVAVGGLDALDASASYRVVGRGNYVISLGSRLLPRAAMARRTASLFRPVAPGSESASDISEAADKRRAFSVAGIALAAAVAGVALAAVQRGNKGKG